MTVVVSSTMKTMKTTTTPLWAERRRAVALRHRRALGAYGIRFPQ